MYVYIELRRNKIHNKILNYPNCLICFFLIKEHEEKSVSK